MTHAEDLPADYAADVYHRDPAPTIHSLDEPIDESGADDTPLRFHPARQESTETPVTDPTGAQAPVPPVEDPEAQRRGVAIGHALMLKGLGFSILPLPTNQKAAPPKDWERAAVNDPAVFLTNPGTGNYAVLPPDGCFGWDVDKDAPAFIERMSKRLGYLPYTLTTRTPNGTHLVFRWPEEAGAMPQGNLFGIVTRRPMSADKGKGYLVGPGSYVTQPDPADDGLYRLLPVFEEDEPIATLPVAWAEEALASQPRRDEGGGAGSGGEVKRIGAGMRHDYLRDKAAFVYRATGLRGDALFAAVWSIYERDCEPYLPPQDPSAEVRRAVGNVEQFQRDEEDGYDGRSVGSDWRIGDLLALDIPTVPFAIPSVLPEKGSIGLVGQYKSGKTTMNMQMAFCLASGLPFLGIAPSRKYSVWLHEPEGSTVGFQNRLRDVWEGLGSPANDDIALRVMHRGFTLKGNLKAGIENMKRMVGDEPPGIWFIGVASRMFGVADENQSAAVEPYLDAIEEFAHWMDGLVVFNHHLRKVDPKRRGVLHPAEFFDMVRGSSAFAGGVDGIVGIDRRPGEAVGRLDVLLRDGETQGFDMVFDYPLFVPPSGLTSIVTPPSDPVSVAVLSALKAPRGPRLTVAELAAFAGVTKTAVEHRLPRLAAAGYIEVVEVVARNAKVYQMVRVP